MWQLHAAPSQFPSLFANLSSTTLKADLQSQAIFSPVLPEVSWVPRDILVISLFPKAPQGADRLPLLPCTYTHMWKVYPGLCAQVYM